MTYGVTYESLLKPWLTGARRIEVVDPYISAPYQVANLVDLLALIVRSNTLEGPELAAGVTVHLQTSEDGQRTRLDEVVTSAARVGVNFTYEYCTEMHDRWIQTDTGWRVMLGRGLDIYKQFPRDRASIELRVPELRPTQSFTVTYVRIG